MDYDLFNYYIINESIELDVLNANYNSVFSVIFIWVFLFHFFSDLFTLRTDIGICLYIFVETDFGRGRSSVVNHTIDTE